MKKEDAFKASKKNEDELKRSNCLDNVEENLMRRPRKGSRKYKGKFPIKCFSFGIIVHYDTSCTFKEYNYRRTDHYDNKRMDNYRRDDKKKEMMTRIRLRRFFIHYKSIHLNMKIVII